MAHSIELLLDQRADTTIRQLGQALADAGLPSQMKVTSDTNRPHITLIAAQRIAPDVDGALTELADSFPLDVTLGAPVVFGAGSRLTLARLVVASAELFALHEQVYARSLPFAPNLFAHSQPGQWTPHVTLGRRFTPAQIGDALAAVRLTTDIAAAMTGLRRWDGDARTEHSLIR